jgi:hypothetical protein
MGDRWFAARRWAALGAVGALAAVAFAVGVGRVAVAAQAQGVPPGLHLLPSAPAAWRASAEECLGRLRRNPLGLAVMDALARGRYPHVLAPWGGSTNSDRTYPPVSAENGYLRDDGRANVGAGTATQWNPNDRADYFDGTPKDPCSALLHELQHALDFERGVALQKKYCYPGTFIGAAEVRADTLQNYYLWKLGRQQRSYHLERHLPKGAWGPYKLPSLARFGGLHRGAPRYLRTGGPGRFALCAPVVVDVEQQGPWGGGTIISNPIGIDCVFTAKVPPQEPSVSGHCQAIFPAQSKVTLIAKPDPVSSSSTQWGLGSGCKTNFCTVQLGTGRMTATVGFNLHRYTLTVNNPDPTWGVLTTGALDGTIYCGRPEEPQPQKCSGLYDYGSVVGITATPDPPATGIEAFDNCTSTPPPPFVGSGVCQVPITGNETITVHWLTG